MGTVAKILKKFPRVCPKLQRRREAAIDSIIRVITDEDVVCHRQLFFCAIS